MHTYTSTTTTRDWTSLALDHGDLIHDTLGDIDVLLDVAIERLSDTGWRDVGRLLAILDARLDHYRARAEALDAERRRLAAEQEPEPPSAPEPTAAEMVDVCRVLTREFERRAEAEAAAPGRCQNG